MDNGYEAVLVDTTYKQQIAGPAYVDGTGNTEGAFTTLEEAISALPDDGGTVIVCGDTTVGIASATVTLPANSGKVTLKSINDATLTIGRAVVLGCEMEIDNIELCNGSTTGHGFIYANGNKLTIGENVTTTKATGVNNYLFIYGGHPDKDVASTHLIIKSGTYSNVLGANHSAPFTGTTKVEVSNITVTNLLTMGSFNSFAGTGELILDLRGNKTVTAKTYGTISKILVDDGYEAVKDGTTYKQQKKVIVGDANGDGDITVVDALLILKAIVNDSILENADMNGDDKITLVDVMRVLKQATN